MRAFYSGSGRFSADPGSRRWCGAGPGIASCSRAARCGSGRRRRSAGSCGSPPGRWPHADGHVPDTVAPGQGCGGQSGQHVRDGWLTVPPAPFVPQELQSALTVRQISRTVVAEPFTRDAKTPQAGQARAEASAVGRWTRRPPTSHRSTRMADTPSRTGSNVDQARGSPLILLRREQK